MEIAAITGHKSLSMLKRYTHLKARDLVHKLEGQRNKAKAAVISHMIPYPALVVRKQNEIEVRLLDFEGLSSKAQDVDSALVGARDLLMRTILHRIRSSSTIPSPDQFLDTIPEEAIVMVDPLACDTLLQN